jgi:octaprenyl-diphosphate synthase
VRNIKKLIRSKTPDKKKIREVVAFIEQYGGLEYARERMNALRDEAFEILDRVAKPTPNREHLRNLVTFVIEREN